MPAQRDPRLALARFLANVAVTLKPDPRFAAEVCSAAYRLAIPLPAAGVSYRTCSAVARRCTDLIASGPPLSSPATDSPSNGGPVSTVGYGPAPESLRAVLTRCVCGER